jgi:hypothetical protein
MVARSARITKAKMRRAAMLHRDGLGDMQFLFRISNGEDQGF